MSVSKCKGVINVFCISQTVFLHLFRFYLFIHNYTSTAMPLVCPLSMRRYRESDHCPLVHQGSIQLQV